MRTFLALWGANILRVAGLAWILFLGWGLGQTLLRRLRLAPRTPGEEALLAAGLGLGVVSLLTLGLGAAGGYRPVAMGAALAVLSVIALGALRRHPPRLGGIAGQSSGGNPVPSLLFGGAALLAGLTALSPPLFYDALVYHLGVPNLFLLRDGIEHLPHNVYSNFPFGAEMLYLLALHLGGPELAGLVNFAFGLLAAIVLAAIVRPRWGERPARVAAALFLLTPQVLLLSRFATTELPMTFFTLLAFLCLLRWSEEERRADLILAGVFGGFAFSTKYLGGLFAVLAPAGYLLLRRRPRALGLLLAAAGLAASPWLLKNLLLTGNPVHPAFFGLLGGSDWSEGQAATLAADAHAAWFMAGSWKDWLELPLQVVLPRRDLGVPDEGGWVWLPVLAAAAFVAVRRRGGAERLLLWLFASCTLLWAATFWIARFLLPALALGTVLIALALEGLAAGARRRLPEAALLLFCAGTVLTFAGDELAGRALQRALKPALGLQTRDAYLASFLRIHPAVDFANRRLPRDARLLVLGDAKTAYLRRDHVAGTVLDRSPLPALLGPADDAEGMALALRRAGITHVLVNARELERTAAEYPLSSPPAALLQAFLVFLEQRGELLLRGNGVFLYRVAGPAEAAPASPLSPRPSAGGGASPPG